MSVLVKLKPKNLFDMNQDLFYKGKNIFNDESPIDNWNNSYVNYHKVNNLIDT
jgi:hypothetical protein